MRLQSFVLVPAALVFAGCTSLLGDFAVGSAESANEAGTATVDGSTDATASDAGTPGQGDASAEDSGLSALEDGGASDADAADAGFDATPCGALGEACCASDPNAPCAGSTLDCINGECHSAATGDLGKACTDAGACASGVCLDVNGDGGADEDAGYAGSVCTNACSSDAGTLYSNDAGLGDKCLAGWICGQIPGSTPACTCTRAPETCNGKDDDCDGVVDNGTTGNNCSTGKPGVCAAGMTTCVSGVAGCAETTPPSKEVCNGLDDDCDGVIDNGTTGNNCSTGKPGVCAAGTTTCVGGDPGCAETTQPTAEVCDGLDNNCNGQVDEGDPGGGGSCSAPGEKGACAVGVYTCTGGSVQCVSQISPSTAWHYTAASNGSWDWNCDGTVTESEPSGGSFWGTSYVNCTSSATYAAICDDLSSSAPVCNGSPVYYHCSPLTNGNHCGETYYDFTCSAGADSCSFPGALSGAMSDGCD